MVPGIADANSKPPRPADRARWRHTALAAPLDALLDRRRPPGEHASIGQLVDDQLAADARYRRLARRIDIGDGDVVGRRQRAGELAGEVTRARDEVRLEQRADRRTGETV